MRIYAVAMMAISNVDDLEPAEPGRVPIGSIVECRPALIPAESIEAAAEAAKSNCLDFWKPEEGWHTHQGTIMGVTKTFCDAFLQAYEADVLEIEDGPLKVFSF